MKTFNTSWWPNVIRAYEIAINGKFSIGLYADLTTYPSAVEDASIIKSVLNRVDWHVNPDIHVEIVKRDFRSMRQGEGLETVLDRCRTYKQTCTSDRLDDVGRALIKTATDRLDLSIDKTYNVIRIAKVIASMDESEFIKANHLAEAIQYQICDATFLFNDYQQKYEYLTGLIETIEDDQLKCTIENILDQMMIELTGDIPNV